MDFLINGGGQGKGTLLLAHGAGAAMDSPAMDLIAHALALRGLRVVRFEFDYMAGRRSGKPKRPPPKVELLMAEFREAVTALNDTAPEGGPLFIGGKSMGGRVASMVADDLHAEGQVTGLLCLGYPFHPTGQPQRLRTAHLAGLRVPTLICQGSRDPFGSCEEVADYALSSAISVAWLEDGNHDFVPRKRLTGLNQQDLIAAMADAVANWADALG